MVPLVIVSYKPLMLEHIVNILIELLQLCVNCGWILKPLIGIPHLEVEAIGHKWLGSCVKFDTLSGTYKS